MTTNPSDASTLGHTASRASQLLRGDRNRAYGDPRDTYTHAALIATGILKQEISPEQVVIVMLAVKLARERHNHAPDNLIDAVGYLDILNYIEELKDAD